MQVRHQKTEIVFSRIDSCCCKTSSVHSQSWWFVEIKKKSFILKKNHCVRLRCLSMKMFRFEKKNLSLQKGPLLQVLYHQKNRPRLTKYEDYIHCACYSWPNFNHWRWNFLSQWRKILSSGKVLCPFWNMLCKVISNSLSNINWYHTNGMSISSLFCILAQSASMTSQTQIDSPKTSLE